MTRAQRLTFLGIAAAIAVVAVILLATGGDKTEDASDSAQRRSTAAATATATDSAAEATATAKPPPLLRTGDVKALTYKQGETVRFRGRSAEKDDVHVHGYDIKQDLEPGKTATMSFKASITGIFEIELEVSGMQLAELKVLP